MHKLKQQAMDPETGSQYPKRPVGASGDTFFYTTRQAAKILGVSLRTVQVWADAKFLQTWKTRGGHRRLDCRSVERLAMNRPDGANKNTYPAPRFAYKLLIVEDDPILLKLYRVAIASWGLPIEVVTARNGIEALLALGRESPTIMIADLALPELDGFELMSWLSTSTYREGMEIVVVSGLSDDELSAHPALPEGIRLLRKPVPMAALHALLVEIVDSINSRIEGGWSRANG